jgi:hypothetical protein
MENHMVHLRAFSLPAAVLLVAGLSSCASLRLEPADFGWPVESALTVSQANTVEEPRYSVAFNVAALAADEFQDTSALKGTTLHVLRSPDGCYFITGAGFENLYVFNADGLALSLREKVRVVPERENGRKGLRNPALNQRPPHIELLDDAGVRFLLTSSGIAEQSSPKREKE